MPATTTTGFLIRKLLDAPSVPCPCGVSTRPLTAADALSCSLHVTSITDSARHYHRETTEVYYILEGNGKIELNGDWHVIEPGMTIWIEPGTRHHVVSEAGIKTIVFSVPGLNTADEWFD